MVSTVHFHRIVSLDITLRFKNRGGYRLTLIYVVYARKQAVKCHIMYIFALCKSHV